jgi:benzoyl-CoA reductase/2-hydroxyglutaryl-CoA dehydratase subunit BcrC/BadD/HgdB
MNTERGLLRKAFEYGKLDPPVVTGMELAQLRFRAAGMKSHHVMMNKFIEMLEKRRQAGETVASKNAVRVLLTGCPTGQGTEKVIELIEESGGIVVVQESCSGMKGIEGDTPLEGDPLEAVARRHFELPCSCMTPNTGRNGLIARLAKEFNAQAVVDLVWQACHTYNVESFLVEKFVREKLGLPYLKIETDYSPSDREQLRVRIQTLLELAE